MTLLCLTGWQQPPDALAELAPNAVHFDYSAYSNADAMFAALPRTADLAIGWSLGGQLLVRAVAGGYLKPKALLLLGAPFQWVAGEGIAKGIPVEAVAEVRDNYQRDPKAMLKNLNALIALGDRDEKSIVRTLNAVLSVWDNGLYWLDELTKTSCSALNFSAFPPTVIVHGDKDKVIHPVNADAYMAALPKAELMKWPDCAHAPHLHDMHALQTLVSKYV